MLERAEVLVCGCREDDLAVLKSAAEPLGPRLRAVDGPVKLARHAMANCPVAVVLGVRDTCLSDLDVIPVLRAIRADLPVVVIAEEDSIELERAARQNGIFYYLIHPVERFEVRAVLRDVLRCARG